MIRSHRDRHRRIFWLLAVLLPALLAAAILARPRPPVLDRPVPGIEGFREPGGAR
jgi:hypothetical protein